MLKTNTWVESENYSLMKLFIDIHFKMKFIVGEKNKFLKQYNIMRFRATSEEYYHKLLRPFNV